MTAQGKATVSDFTEAFNVNEDRYYYLKKKHPELVKAAMRFLELEHQQAHIPRRKRG